MKTKYAEHYYPGILLPLRREEVTCQSGSFQSGLNVPVGEITPDVNRTACVLLPGGRVVSGRCAVKGMAALAAVDFRTISEFLQDRRVWLVPPLEVPKTQVAL
jgi:hypothetical protein